MRGKNVYKTKYLIRNWKDHNRSLIQRGSITDLVIDSTGLKVYGEGEWKVRQHGYSKRRTWRKLKGYHRRSLAETGMYRFKVLFGRDLKCRTFQAQQSEVYVKAKALNTMTTLGMPQSTRRVA